MSKGKFEASKGAKVRDRTYATQRKTSRTGSFAAPKKSVSKLWPILAAVAGVLVVAAGILLILKQNRPAGTPAKPETTGVYVPQGMSRAELEELAQQASVLLRSSDLVLTLEPQGWDPEAAEQTEATAPQTETTAPQTEAPADEKAGLVDGGIGYNLRRATAERATSARHAVDVLLDLVSRWGYASPGRIYTLADSHEAWIVQVKHGRERYVARRVPDGEVALIPNCYTVRTFREGDIRAPSLDGCALDFDFARAFQGETKWKAPVNQGRWRNLVRIFTGGEWPTDDYPFSVKPRAKVDEAIIRRALGTHYEGTPDEVPVGADGTRHDESRFAPICRRTTAESAIYAFGASPRDLRVSRCLGSPCLGHYETVFPLADPNTDPSVIDRLERHNLPER